MHVSVLILSFLFSMGFQSHRAGDTPVARSMNAVITGKITDNRTGEELTGVTVRVEGTDEEVFTDLNGEFEIRAVPSGSSFNLEVEMISYRKTIVRNVEPGQPVILIRLNGNSTDRAGKKIPLRPAA